MIGIGYYGGAVSPTLNQIAKGIKKEQKCSRQHSYRLAHRVIDAMVEMDLTDQAGNDREEFLIRKRIRKEWSDTLQGIVSFAE